MLSSHNLLLLLLDGGFCYPPFFSEEKYYNTEYKNTDNVIPEHTTRCNDACSTSHNFATTKEVYTIGNDIDKNGHFSFNIDNPLNSCIHVLEMSYQININNEQYIKYDAHCPAAPVFAYDEKLVDLFLEFILLVIFSNNEKNKTILNSKKVYLISFSRTFSIKILKLLEKLKNNYPKSKITEPRSREWLIYDVNLLSIGYNLINFIGTGHYYNLGFALSLFTNHTFLFLIDLLIQCRNDYDVNRHNEIKDEVLTKICTKHQLFIYNSLENSNYNIFTSGELTVYQKMKYFVLKLLKGYKFSHKIKTKELKNYQIHKNNDTNKFEYYPTTNNINMQEKSKKKKRCKSYHDFSDMDVFSLKNKCIEENITTIDELNALDSNLLDEFILKIGQEYNLIITVNTLTEFLNGNMEKSKKKKRYKSYHDFTDMDVIHLRNKCIEKNITTIDELNALDSNLLDEFILKIEQEYGLIIGLKTLTDFLNGNMKKSKKKAAQYKNSRAANAKLASSEF